MELKTDESEGKILKIFIKIKKFLKSLEIWFRVWKHIFGKNYFENQKNSRIKICLQGANFLKK